MNNPRSNQAHTNYSVIEFDDTQFLLSYYPIDTIISNAKAFIMGTYHGLSELHLQRYLDEFCYRFNRRKFTMQHFARAPFLVLLQSVALLFNVYRHITF